jgi:alkanesulfonate monooxygenase SsuD/methylene tetrahydromethanopterin reductase-like flavin-dependent oxidoreductase (luciferase family)
MPRRPVRPNPAKDAGRRRDVREWFDAFHAGWRCRFCGEAYTPALAVYVDPTTCRPPLDLAKWARAGASPETIERAASEGVILCPTCKRKVECLPKAKPRARR